MALVRPDSERSLSINAPIMSIDISAGGNMARSNSRGAPQGSASQRRMRAQARVEELHSLRVALVEFGNVHADPLLVGAA